MRSGSLKIVNVAGLQRPFTVIAGLVLLALALLPLLVMAMRQPWRRQGG